MLWVRMLAYITGTVDQELLLRNEYLAAENRILRAQVQGRLLLSDAEKATLAEIAYRLGRKALEQVLPRVSRRDPGGRHRTNCLAGQKSESERLCGTLGQVGQGRMFVEADPVGRGFSAPSATPLRGPLS